MAGKIANKGKSEMDDANEQGKLEQDIIRKSIERIVARYHAFLLNGGLDKFMSICRRSYFRIFFDPIMIDIVMQVQMIIGFLGRQVLHQGCASEPTIRVDLDSKVRRSEHSPNDTC